MVKHYVNFLINEYDDNSSNHKKIRNTSVYTFI